MRIGFRRVAIAIGAVAAMASIGPPATAQAQAPQEVLTNIAYAPAQPAGSRGHLLDLYLPDGADEPVPLVIWSSGSAWTGDDGKAGASSIAAQFTARGYAVAGVSVRSSSQAQFPAQVYDVKSAIRWLRANAGTYGIDPDRFAIMGDSSGGWVADMATLTGGVSQLEGNIGVTGVSSAVQAGVSFFGPTDFLRMNAQAGPGSQIDHDAADSPESMLVGCAIQTCPGTVARANPITYVDANDPPMMLLHGQADNLVPHGQSQILYEALRSACTDAQFFSIPGAGHGTGDVLNPSRHTSHTVRTTTGCGETVTTGSPDPSWSLIADFLDEALGAGGGGEEPPVGDCRASVDVVGDWGTGWQGKVTVTAGGAAVDGWSLRWTWPGPQRVQSAWNAEWSQSGTVVTASDVGWNARVEAGASREVFGFVASGPAAELDFDC
jgi:acetyl esterase/lipase